jgi:hypothetical protein
MRHFQTDDAGAGQLLMRAEERLAEARAFTTGRALLPDAPRQPRAARIWLGSVLIAVGNRLVRPLPKAATPA